jgi:hypothetical protein
MRRRVVSMGRKVATAAAACIVAGAAGVGCRVPVAPGNAVRVAAPPSYAAWWSEDLQCSGLTGDLRQVEWYVVPAERDGGFWCADGPDHTCAGEWVAPNSVYLAGPSRTYPDGYAADEWTVRHEMLHDLVGQPGHPPVFDDCRLASRTPDGVYGLGR